MKRAARWTGLGILKRFHGLGAIAPLIAQMIAAGDAGPGADDA